MPYLKCPNCETIFHIAVSNLNTFFERFGKPTKGNIPEEICFFCWKDLKVSDLIEVIKLSESVPLAKVNDTARVIDIYNENNPYTLYKVESIENKAGTKWSGQFIRSQIRFVHERFATS